MMNGTLVTLDEAGPGEPVMALTTAEIIRMESEEPPECAYGEAEHDFNEVDHGTDGNNPDRFHLCGECRGCGLLECERED